MASRFADFVAGSRSKPPRGSDVSRLIEYNREWAEAIKERDPMFFKQLSAVQRPGYLWYGCSDSRVPANQIVGLAPGEVFVHRNVANVIPRADLNALSVLQFGTEHLKVHDVIVCGHYGCGGITSAYRNHRRGFIDNWLMHVKDVLSRYRNIIDDIPEEKREDALCELNVVAQLANLADTHVLQDYWARGRKGETGVQDVTLHGWVYGLDNGLIRPLMTFTREDHLQSKVSEAVSRIHKKYTKV